MFQGKFEAEYIDRMPRHVRDENNYIMPPGQVFAKSLITKYLRTAPMNFQVHRPPKVMDLTQTIGDGVNSYEKDDVKRRIQILNLQNPDLNKVMAEQGAKKIAFLKNVQSNYIDQQKLEVIESLKVKTNEHDERVLMKQTIHSEGRIHPDVVPVVFQHQQKLK